MKILLISDVFPTNFPTSVGTIVENLAQGFKKLGHQVLIITATQNKKESGLTDYNGLAVWQVYANISPRLRSYQSLYNPQALKVVKKIINQFTPTIVHVHLVHYALSYYCLKLAKKSGAKVFLTAHDVMLFHYGKLTEFIDPTDLSIPKNFNYKITPWQQIKKYKRRYNPFRNLIIRHYLKYVDKIFAVSFALKEALRQNGIKNVEVVYNSIDLENWQIPDKIIQEFKNNFNLHHRKVILFGGRLNELKGGEQIVKAMKEIIAKVPAAILLILGNRQGYAEELLALARVMMIEKNFIFTGWLSGDQLKAAYFSSDIVVSPSICFDTFGMINLEAMACQKPVIGSCFGGMPEVIQDKINGYIINPYNIELMAEKIIDLLVNQKKAKQFGEAGYEIVKQKFTLDLQLVQYLNYYKN